MMLKQVIIGLLLLCGGAGILQASYVTGFETSDNAGFVVGQTLYGVDGWYQLQGGNNDATTVGSPVYAGMQAAQFQKTSATSRSALEFDALAGDIVVLDFHMAFERTAGTTSGVSNYVLFGNASDMLVTGGQPERAAVMLGFTRTGNADQLVYRDGNTNIALGAVVPEEYYHIVAYVNLDTQTYDLTVTGSNINAEIQNIAFRDTNEITQVNSLMAMMLSDDSRFYMDNLSFNLIPEPGTLTLAGLGAMLLFGRRNCR